LVLPHHDDWSAFTPVSRCRLHLVHYHVAMDVSQIWLIIASTSYPKCGKSADSSRLVFRLLHPTIVARGGRGGRLGDNLLELLRLVWEIRPRRWLPATRTLDQL
jgi:hypothetical protein